MERKEEVGISSLRLELAMRAGLPGDSIPQRLPLEHSAQLRPTHRGEVGHRRSLSARSFLAGAGLSRRRIDLGAERVDLQRRDRARARSLRSGPAPRERLNERSGAGPERGRECPAPRPQPTTGRAARPHGVGSGCSVDYPRADQPEGSGIPSNPAARLEVERPRKRPIRLLSPEEVERVADAIDPRYSAMVLASAYGALRFGEVAGLRRRDLRLLDRPPKVLVHGTVIQVGGKVERVDHAKTEGSVREVAIPSFLAEELARHLAAYPQPDDDGLVFRAPAGRPLARTVFRNRQWVPACERAGLAVAGRSADGRCGWKVAPPRFHDLRHVGVTLAIKAGAHPLTISRWVGHTEIGTTMNVYGHLFPGAHEEMVAGLDALRADALAKREPVGELVALGS